MIVVENINKFFGEKQVLKNLSATFHAGKINLIIGKSGSGKTIAIKCMLGLHSVDSGSIFFNDRDFLNIDKSDKKQIRKEIGMVFQGGALFDSMTVEENVMFPLKMAKKMSMSEMQKRVDFCLNRVDLKNVNSLFPSELSGGMQKRVAIARAIALNPKYLFCDEPNSGLDPTTAIVIVLAFFSMSWIIWAALMVAMMLFLGPRHPRTTDEHVPLDPTRQLIALGTVVIFILCFTPTPIEVLDIIAQR